ncbi:hypothetical protein MHU86_269 [Fragilaria crotonensis]|nr:hypothetical protein MHU86_269 [Fragilaria crotonensis]
MNPDHSTCTSNNEDDIQSSTHQLKHDDFISIGTDSAKNPPQLSRFQFGQRDQANCPSSGTGEASQAIDSLLLMKFQEFIGVSSDNWQCEDGHSFHFTFADNINFLQDEDYEESYNGETYDDDEDEDSICDSIRVTVRRRLKQGTMSSADNECSE